LKVTQERLPESRVQLDVEVDQERVDKQFEAAYRRLAPKARIPGFRPGKAPRQIIERHLGRDRIMAEALDRLVPDVYNEVLESEELDAVDQPTLDKVDLDPVRLTFVVPVRPTVELGDYRSIRVESQPVEVTDEEVAEEIQNIRQRQATKVDVDRPVQWNDWITGSVKASVESDEEGGDPDEFIGDDDVEFTVREGRVLVAEGLAEAIVGMAAGETKTIELDMPDDFQLERVKGKKATFTITVKDIQEEQLPPEDDQLGKAIDAEQFPDLETLKARIRSDFEAQKQGQEDQRIRTEAIDQLVAMSSIEYPEVMVEHEIDHVIKDITGTEASQYAAQLQRIGRSEADFRSQWREPAAERLKRGLVLAKLTEAEGINPTADDIDAEIDRLVGPMPEEDGSRFRELFTSMEGIDSVRRNIISQRTLERLATIAKGEAVDDAPASEPEAAAASEEDAE
jgi:trigger factor